MRCFCLRREFLPPVASDQPSTGSRFRLAARPTHGRDSRMPDNSRYPTDIIMDDEGCWRALYSDGSLGPPLTLDEMLDVLPYLRESSGEVTDTFQ